MNYQHRLTGLLTIFSQKPNVIQEKDAQSLQNNPSTTFKDIVSYFYTNYLGYQGEISGTDWKSWRDAISNVIGP